MNQNAPQPAKNLQFSASVETIGTTYLHYNMPDELCPLFFLNSLYSLVARDTQLRRFRQRPDGGEQELGVGRRPGTTLFGTSKKTSNRCFMASVTASNY